MLLSCLHPGENPMLAVRKTNEPSTATPTEMAAPRRAEQAPPATSPKLLDRLREALRSRHYSQRTERTYWHWVKRFIYDLHPRSQLGRQGRQEPRGRFVEEKRRCVIQKPYIPPPQVLQVA